MDSARININAADVGTRARTTGKYANADSKSPRWTRGDVGLAQWEAGYGYRPISYKRPESGSVAKSRTGARSQSWPWSRETTLFNFHALAPTAAAFARRLP